MKKILGLGIYSCALMINFIQCVDSHQKYGNYQSTNNNRSSKKPDSARALVQSDSLGNNNTYGKNYSSSNYNSGKQNCTSKYKRTSNYVPKNESKQNNNNKISSVEKATKSSSLEDANLNNYSSSNYNSGKQNCTSNYKSTLICVPKNESKQNNNNKISSVEKATKSSSLEDANLNNYSSSNYNSGKQHYKSTLSYVPKNESKQNNNNKISSVEKVTKSSSLEDANLNNYSSDNYDSKYELDSHVSELNNRVVQYKNELKQKMEILNNEKIRYDNLMNDIFKQLLDDYKTKDIDKIKNKINEKKLTLIKSIEEKYVKNTNSEYLIKLKETNNRYNIKLQDIVNKHILILEYKSKISNINMQLNAYNEISK